MEVLDPGHKYKLATLDGDVEVVLTHVKRNSPSEKYPGNVDAYPGTTTQEVLRAELDRARYVDKQIGHRENLEVIVHLQLALCALERRAAELHGRTTRNINVHNAEFGPFCTVCGHINHQCPE